MRPNRRVLWLTVLPLALSACGSLNLFSACRAEYQRPDFSLLQQQLNSAQTLWKLAGTKDYSYEFSQFTAPIEFPRVRITVKQGVVISTQPLDAPPIGYSLTIPGGTIDERFSDIASAIVGYSKTECGELAVSYDPYDGHLLNFESEIALKNIADGNGAWTISNFTRL